MKRQEGTESYVLRIYRRSKTGETNVIGVLEEPATGQQWSFRNLLELNQLIKDQAD